MQTAPPLITLLTDLGTRDAYVAVMKTVISRLCPEAEPGEPLALFGSSGRLEIAVRGGRAAAQLGLAKGATLNIEYEQ